METRVDGQLVHKKEATRSVFVNGVNLVVGGRWLPVARIQDEVWIGAEAAGEPEPLIASLKKGILKADLFTFAQRLPNTHPRYEYPMVWDNVAAIPITRYEDWWENRLPQIARKNVRRGYKRGVVAAIMEFNDELVAGIVGIHDETPIKQGEPFAHYGKPFDVVKREYGTFLDRSDFIAAHYEGELIGVLKLVYVDQVASIMQIIAKEAHQDKRPTNILIAKAVERCVVKGMSFLVYGKYTYGNKTNSSLSEFKCRNGFEKIDFPRYYIPLTLKGEMALKLKLHHGLLGLLPARLIAWLLSLRARYYKIRMHSQASATSEMPEKASKSLSELDCS